MINRYRHETCFSDRNGPHHSHAIADLPVDDVVIAAQKNLRDREAMTLGVVAHTTQTTIGSIVFFVSVIRSHTA